MSAGSAVHLYSRITTCRHQIFHPRNIPQCELLMMLNTEEQGELNLLVVQYLEKVNSKLTDKFSRAANIPPVSERDLTKTSSHSLEAVVKFFLETQNGANSKRKFPDEDESLQTTEKKQKKEKV